MENESRRENGEEARKIQWVDVFLSSYGEVRRSRRRKIIWEEKNGDETQKTLKGFICLSRCSDRRNRRKRLMIIVIIIMEKEREGKREGKVIITVCSFFSLMCIFLSW